MANEISLHLHTGLLRFLTIHKGLEKDHMSWNSEVVARYVLDKVRKTALGRFVFY